ncbi:MAG: maleylacetate reductase [Betaproteobacteria bacterium]|nr:maleylacetate reductase [Betaproteobacteria bacterium]
MSPFVFTGFPYRVVFGAGSLDKLGEEMTRLGAKRALILSTPEQRSDAAAIAATLGDRCAGVFDQAVMHVPIEIARAARTLATNLKADCAVTIGGGSTTGLGKAIALESSLPIIAIPTTYAGSEVTPIWGITEGGLKKTGKDARVLPKVVIYDPLLTMSLPAKLSATSGINAIAHAVEGLYAQDANPIMSMIAEEGIRAMAKGLPLVVENPTNAEARANCLYGAWLCGSALASVGMALHHKLCHTLGGTWNLPHAETHTIVLPHACAYSAAAAPLAMQRIARALEASSAPRGLFDLAQSLGASVALKDLGIKEFDLDRAADLATQAPYWNPRPIERNAIRKLLDDAYFGRRPD